MTAEKVSFSMQTDSLFLEGIILNEIFFQLSCERTKECCLKVNLIILLQMKYVLMFISEHMNLHYNKQKNLRMGIDIEKIICKIK